ncbi:prolipoprotein diacylglyceryl transferase [Micromonospora mirobrigensis]|uniref:Phosphatidylglycerol--prolipoprotein diacylglyceryl transferase n=1 Tax=Micromonospora mirobrigensis TaxID=262898 RepID=A0A1C5A9J4_9ACTN|nr:prolipoprotein diacylglyceryl transferase [Micromonospora mirobrigensis]SCF41922.1 prolipoprotein diacylglyceryl transferase [Micromonospora mirobrigensis]
MTLASTIPQAALPSPSTAVWQLGPVPIRAYALCIILGIVVACVVTEWRLRRRGVAPGAVLDIAVWAVPTGIIGARIYHVITSPDKYFGDGGQPLKAFAIWEGGLGIWGAVAGGAIGAWIAARQLGIPFAVVADALAPGLPLAQAVGRFGNWFNNELYGGRTTLPWGLEVHRMDPGNPGHAELADGKPVLEPGLYHPTFLYEALWNIGVAALVLLVDRRFKLGRGRAFALYVMGYTAGRFWIELMRSDPATHILGVRLNVWTAALVFVGALIYFLRVRGPREYLIPIGVQAPAVPAGGGDLSQVDLAQRETGPATVAPEGYRVVSEEQFRTYQETGVPPEEPTPTDAAGEAAAAGDDEPVDRDATDDRPTGPDPQDRATADQNDRVAADQGDRVAADQGDRVAADQDDRAGAAGGRPADRDS